MPNKSVHLTRGAGAPLAGKLRRYAGTLKARSALGSFALRARFPKTLRGKATVNPRNFGQPWIPAGRTIWIVDAHRDDGRRFIVHADEKLSAFVELEREVFNRDVLSRIHSCRRP
jgi:hypothetical protein